MVIRVIVKSLLLLFLLNYAFILVMDVPIGKPSLYNRLFTGRERLPFGENPQESYNLSIYNLDAMIASHKIAALPKAADEYRVFVVGDSSVWGYLQPPEKTLAGMLDLKQLRCNSKTVRVYNLGYPSLSVVKDLMIIDRVKAYEPDLILWMVTLESLPGDLQTATPLVANNVITLNHLINAYELDIPRLDDDYRNYTLIGRRRELADLMRLQFYGLMWSATGIDQEYPAGYNPAQRDFDEDYSFHDFETNELDTDRLAISVIEKTINLNNDLDFAVINEPILVSNGVNSDIRYNYYYPRWAYDQYRAWMENEMQHAGIVYYDLWNLVPERHFTNSAIHLDYTGEEILTERISSILEDTCKAKK